MKYEPDDEDAIRQFVTDGCVVYHSVFDPILIEEGRNFILARHERFMDMHRKGAIPLDVNGWGVAIMRLFEQSKIYDEMLRSPPYVAIAQKYLGPDVACLNQPGLFINASGDSDPVTKKGWHTDVWTGSGVDTLFAILFFTDADKHNGLSVWPGSHLQGLFPVRNRQIDPICNVQMQGLDLETKQGDLVLWHSLIIHATTGRSPTNTRISMTMRLLSQESELTSQERAVGYRAMSVGPLNQVRRLIGNDYMEPFRTHGGYVGIDRTMANLFNYCPYKSGVDYDQYLT